MLPLLYNPPNGTPPAAAAVSFAKSKLADTCDNITQPFSILDAFVLPEKKLREPVISSDPDSCCVIVRLPVVRNEPIDIEGAQDADIAYDELSTELVPCGPHTFEAVIKLAVGTVVNVMLPLEFEPVPFTFRAKVPFAVG